MASVDSGVETSNESNDSSIVQEPKTLEMSPIKIPRGVSLVLSKACALGNSDTEEKSYGFITPPEFPDFEAAATVNKVVTVPYRDFRHRVYRHAKRTPNDRKMLSYIAEVKCLVSERKLRLAASTNNEELVAALLESGVNPNGHDNHRRTALHLASCRGFTNIVRMLLEKGANPNLKDALDNTPLHLAACTNHVEVVTLLLKAGTDINSSDSYGRSPLQLAQSKLKLLHQSCSNNEDSMRVKQEVQKVIEMILTFLQKKCQETEAGLLNEMLNSFQNRFNISQTKEEVKTDVRDLLDSLNNLNLNKSDG